jgi:hypothetical protein
MTDYPAILRDFVIQLQSAKAEMILCFLVIAFGYLLKTLPFVPNRFIPSICMTVSTVTYPLILDTSSAAPYQMRYPIVRQAIIGFLIGFVAWAFHRAFLKNWLDKRFPQSVDKKGDTKFFPKPDEPKL